MQRSALASWLNATLSTCLAECNAQLKLQGVARKRPKNVHLSEFPDATIGGLPSIVPKWYTSAPLTTLTP